MKALKSAAAIRLFKKLSALRVTLPTDERKLLDAFLTVDTVKPQARGAARIRVKPGAKTARPQIQFDTSRKEYQLLDD